MESIDFEGMDIGARVALPAGKWGDIQRVGYDAANEYARQHPGVQFQVEGHEGSDFERGQYWIVRTK